MWKTVINKQEHNVLSNLEILQSFYANKTNYVSLSI